MNTHLNRKVIFVLYETLSIKGKICSQVEFFLLKSFLPFLQDFYDAPFSETSTCDITLQMLISCINYKSRWPYPPEKQFARFLRRA